MLERPHLSREGSALEPALGLLVTSQGEQEIGYTVQVAEDLGLDGTGPPDPSRPPDARRAERQSEQHPARPKRAARPAGRTLAGADAVSSNSSMSGSACSVIRGVTFDTPSCSLAWFSRDVASCAPATNISRCSRTTICSTRSTRPAASGQAESRHGLVQGPVDLGPQIIFRDPAPIKQAGCPVVSLLRVDLHHERH